MLKDTLGYLLLPLCFFLFSFNLEAKRENRILNFHTDIRMDTSGRADITETIKVLYTKQQPRKEIVRKITNYRYGDKNPEVEIHVDSVLRNGEIKKYSTTNEYTKFSIEIDNERKKLQPGIYEYTFKYWSDNFFDYNHQSGELIWDVNGNDLFFEIDSISATVHLPKGSKSIANECNILITGECSYKNIGDTVIEFYGNQTLPSFRNFKIGTSFTPKVIEETSLSGRIPLSDLFQADIETISFAVIITLLCLFFIFWWLINTMHKKVIVRRNSYPPLGKSPTTIRYIFKRDSDIKGLMVCLVSMAVKKTILIKKTGNLSYTLSSLGNKKELSEDELIVYNKLFTGVAQDVIIGVSGKKKCIKNAFLELGERLTTDNQKYILPRFPYVIRFICISLSLMLLCFSFNRSLYEMILDSFLNVLILLYIVFFSYLLAWKFSKLSLSLITSCVTWTIVVPFINWDPNPRLFSLLGTAFIFVIINSLFMRLIDPLTKSGVQYQAELKGFRINMAITEDELMKKEDLTPEYFEEMLPYAMALNIETKWAKKFDQVSTDYLPSWYLGPTGKSHLEFTQMISKSLKQSLYRNTSQLSRMVFHT